MQTHEENLRFFVIKFRDLIQDLTLMAVMDYFKQANKIEHVSRIR